MKKYKHIFIDNKWLVIILFIATILRFYKLDFQSLWMDEIYTMNVSNPNLSFKEFHYEMILREGFPYLYFILLKLFYFLFGYTPFVARSFSAFIGVVCVYAIYKLGKELINKNTGLIAATLLTVSEYNIYISQDARPYTLYFLATVFTFYKLSIFLKNATIKNAIWYGISAGILLNVNFFGFINLLSNIFIVLFFVWNAPKSERVLLMKYSCISGFIAILLFLPNLDMLIKLLNYKSFWVPAPTNESFSLLFKDFLGNSEMTLFVFTPLFIFYLISIFNKKQKISLVINNNQVFSFIIYFGWVFIFIYFLMVKSYGEVSLILTRYFTSILPVFYLILATAIYLIKNKYIKAIIITSIFVLTITNLVLVKGYYERINKAQFREASNLIFENHKNKESIFTSQKYWFDYYFTNNGNNKKIEEIELENLIQQMALDSTKIKSFWYIDAFGKTYSPSENTQKFINETFYIENNYDGFQAWAKHFTLLKDVPKTIDVSKYENLKQYNGDQFMLNIETFENNNNTIKTTGWAYFENQVADKSILDVVLIKEGSKIATRLQSLKVNRPDVTSYFKVPFDVSNSGFSATTDITKLEPGEYQLGIYLTNKQTNKEGLILTEKRFVK